jgi:transcriptional regulator GlxA family with amidase domain
MSNNHKILLLGYPGAQILDITGTLQMFSGANDELGWKAYDIVIAAPEPGAFQTSSGIELVANMSFDAISDAVLAETHTILTVGGREGLDDGRLIQDIAAILRRAEPQVARIASVCTGAFFLAAAGLLDGRRAATHWRSAAQLQQDYPAVMVDRDALHIRDGDIWSSAGVTAGMDLALAMIEDDFGRALPLRVARRHVVFRVRPGGQSQFSAELAAQSAPETGLSNLAAKITENPAADWSTETLAETANMSLRTLTRRFRTGLSASPAEFVERVRIDHARRALVEDETPISLIAQRAGFGSTRKMDRAFSRQIGTTPRDFRNRFKSKGKQT